MSQVMVLGAGGWGIALALVATRMSHTVTLWSHDPAELEELRLHNQNKTRLPGVFLPHGIELTGQMETAATADMIVMAVPSFAIRTTARRLRGHIRPGTVVVNAGKGLEDGTLMLLDQEGRVSSTHPEHAVPTKKVFLSLQAAPGWKGVHGYDQ